MALADLLTRLERRTATPDTPCNPGGVSAKPAPLKACTLDTHETPQNGNSESETATASLCWRIHYTDRKPLEVACYPHATHAGILKEYPGAVAAEAFVPAIRRPSAPLTAEEETAMRARLAEETDQATIAEVIGQCQINADARDYWTGLYLPSTATEKTRCTNP